MRAEPNSSLSWMTGEQAAGPKAVGVPSGKILRGVKDAFNFKFSGKGMIIASHLSPFRNQEGHY